MEPQLSKNAVIVLNRRYLKKNSDGEPLESPKELFDRVAGKIAEAELLFDPKANAGAVKEEFLELLNRGWFLPNSPTLMNAGRSLGQLSACFVLPVEDSLESIFDSLKYTAMIHKSGGGTGFSFSRLRPENDVVISTAGVSSGPISFMKVFDTATETVKQGGTRRGANMGILRVDHPDILKFISCKNDPGVLNNFNISVAVTENFMKAFREDGEYELINPRTRQAVRRISASEVFERLIQSAWKNGEPGVVFLDRINRKNVLPGLGPMEATNPCGEQPLLPFESCTLGSVNLSAMVTEGKLDKKRLKKIVKSAVRFLDNVIEMNRYPLSEIKAMTLKTRKIGLGVMGFADMLVKLGIPYDSDRAEKQAEKVMGFIKDTAFEASAALGRERGNFPEYANSIYNTPDTPHMRNATTTTIAPTGTISIIANTSSGIEPVFALAYTRRVLDGEELTEIHPVFEEIAKREGFYSRELAARVAASGSVQNIKEVPPRIRKLFKTAHEISPERHIRIQAAFQKYTDNAVSKTINFPAAASLKDVKEAFLLAYELECKGITIYRDGSRDSQVLSVASPESEPAQEKITPRARPVRTTGVTERICTGCGNLYVTVNSDDEGISEVFAQMGKTGGCASSQTEATGRLISLALRSGVKPDAIVKQLIGIRCPSPAWQRGVQILSCPDAIAQVLRNKAGFPKREAPGSAGVCPECGSLLFPESGCLTCRDCGFSKCG